VGLLSWIFLVVPLGTSSTVSALPLAIRIAYALGDVLILAATLRFITAVRRSPSAVLVAGGLLSLLLYNAVFWLANTRGIWIWGDPADAAWMLYLAAIGAAALHPSMTTIATPGTTGPHEAGTARLVLLAFSSLIPPTVMVNERLNGLHQRRHHDRTQRSSRLDRIADELRHL
jgi:hypothetical protein